MAYIPDPTDPTQPTTNQLAGNMAYELQALKGYLQSIIATGTNFFYIGGYRNRIRNGDFRAAQRGPSIVVAANSAIRPYTLDGWCVTSVGANTTVTQVNALFPKNAFGIQLAQAAGGTSLTLQTLIESPVTSDLVAGTPVTISGYYYVSSLSAGVPVASLNTPTVIDNWTAQTTVGAAVAITAPALPATWQYFKQTFTLAASAINGLSLIFTFPNGAPNFNVAFANIQLEPGSVATPFEIIPDAISIERNQQHYQTYTWWYGGYTGAGGLQFGFPVNLPVPLRATPILTKTAVSVTNGTYPGAPVTLSSTCVVDYITATAAGQVAGSYIGALSAEL